MDITLPELGENVEEAEVLNVLVRKGDAVAKDQPLLELETDKATFELPCPEPGTITGIRVKAGDRVRVGQQILTLDAAAPTAGADAPKAGEARKAPVADRKAEAKKDAEAEQDERRPGKEPAPNEKPAAARQARPVSREADAGEQPAARRPERRSKEDEADGAGGEGDRAQPAPARERGEPVRAGDREIAAGPGARRLAREAGVDLARIRGTGSGGRITPEDVQAFVRERAAAASEEQRARGEARTARGEERAARHDEDAAPVEGDERWGPVERRALTGIEKAAARHLSASWNEIPHVTHHDHADVTELEDARLRYESARKDGEAKLTWTALVVKAVVAGLRAFPKVNSSIDMEREELVLRRSIHVGVAVDTEHGLLVPVIRDAHRKTTRQIAAEIAALAERARARKLGREEMQGATFTVTNLGGIGGVAFTPIVSRPEVAILGVSRSRDDLALRDGKVVRRIVLPLSLSYDHRVVNGADAARFVRHVAELLEDPLHLLMES